MDDLNHGETPMQKLQELLKVHSRLLSALGLFFAGTFTGYLIGKSGPIPAGQEQAVVLASPVPMPGKAKTPAKAAAKTPAKSAKDKKAAETKPTKRR